MAAAGAAARPFDVVVFGATGYTVRASGSRAPVRRFSPMRLLVRAG